MRFFGDMRSIAYESVLHALQNDAGETTTSGAAVVVEDSDDESSPTDCDHCSAMYDSHSRICRVCSVMYCGKCKKVNMKKLGKKTWVHPACEEEGNLDVTGSSAASTDVPIGEQAGASKSEADEVSLVRASSLAL